MCSAVGGALHCGEATPCEVPAGRITGFAPIVSMGPFAECMRNGRWRLVSHRVRRDSSSDESLLGTMRWQRLVAQMEGRRTVCLINPQGWRSARGQWPLPVRAGRGSPCATTVRWFRSPRRWPGVRRGERRARCRHDNMRDRLAAVGGTLTVHAAPGEGTSVDGHGAARPESGRE